MKKQIILKEKNLNAVKISLTENEYSYAKQIAEKTGLTLYKVRYAIKKLRLMNIGVLTTSKGYVLSEFANKRDDLTFLRRLYGRRASDYISLRAAEPDIRKRWNTYADKKLLSFMVMPLSQDISKTEGLKVLLSSEKRFL